MKRRNFIQNGIALTSLSLLPGWAFSQENEPQFLLQFYMDAGWDTTLMTEAWNFQTKPDPAKIFIEYSENDTLAFGGRFVGPTMAPLKKYFSRMTIFNGVIMSPVEVGHPSPAIFAASGASDGSEPSFVCQFMDLFYQNQSASIISNTTVNMAGRAYKVSTIEGLRSINGFGGSVSQQQKPGGSGQLIARSYRDLGDISKKLSEASENNQESIDKITDDEVKLLVKGFLSGMYPAAFINMSRNLDTHGDHVNTHKTNLTENFKDIGKYLNGLSAVPWKNSGKSLLDLTTVVISSDFTRTPALNVSGGKDHNPFSNSMIVMSPKMKSEIIVGQSRLMDAKFSPIGVSTLVAMPVDTTTYSPILRNENTVMLTPSVVFASLLDVNGKITDRSPNVFKKAFKLQNLYKS
ncbi:MAG: DUF1501 domain-containing protein [Bdellovibrionaceae bacterium]|nr:DUF1501 domain-containing protein [Pseudobdellovibrionaceae bacterium]